jgi:hypothetical protein
MNEVWRGRGIAPGAPDYDEMFFVREKNWIVIAPTAGNLRIHELATGKTRAVISVPASSRSFDRFSNVGRHLLIFQRDRNAIPTESVWQKAFAWFPWLADRMRPKYHDCTIVFDLETNRERFRLQGWNTEQALLSDDGSTLITIHDEDMAITIGCWDVTVLKPLRWALGIPVGLGLLLFGLAKVFARWRKRSIAQPVPARSASNG